MPLTDLYSSIIHRTFDPLIGFKSLDLRIKRFPLLAFLKEFKDFFGLHVSYIASPTPSRFLSAVSIALYHLEFIISSTLLDDIYNNLLGMYYVVYNYPMLQGLVSYYLFVWKVREVALASFYDLKLGHKALRIYVIR